MSYQEPPQPPYQGPPQPPYQAGQQPYPAGQPNPLAYSDWLHRVGAYLIDGIPAAVIVLVGLLLSRITFALYALAILAAIGYQAYNRWYLGGQGQSLGKRTLGMKLLSEETGQPIGMLMAFVRDICHVVDSIVCYVGWLFPLWDAKRQTLADKIIKTVVVPA